MVKVSLRMARWLLRSAAVLIIAAAIVLVVHGQWQDASDRALTGNHLQPSLPTAETDSPTSQLDFEEVWKKPLQRVLFDPPPPPPKVEVKPPPPPLNVKLLGTIIDPDRSQAIIQDNQQNVLFRALGESVTPQQPEAIIEQVFPDFIEVRRGEDVTTLNIE